MRTIRTGGDEFHVIVTGDELARLRDDVTTVHREFCAPRDPTCDCRERVALLTPEVEQ